MLILQDHLDRWSRQDSPLHRLHPAAKLIATFAYMLVVLSFPRYEVALLLPMVWFPVALLIWGRVPWRPVAHRLLVVSPFVVLVGVFNPWLDPRVVPVFGIPVGAGWLSFASLVLRFVCTLVALMGLVATTGIGPLTRSMAWTSATGILATQMRLLYRYLFTIADEVARLLTAYRLRSGRSWPRMREAGSLLGGLLRRTYERASRVESAMALRGFSGMYPEGPRCPWTGRDTLFLCGTMGLTVMLRLVPVVLS